MPMYHRRGCAKNPKPGSLMITIVSRYGISFDTPKRNRSTCGLEPFLLCLCPVLDAPPVPLSPSSSSEPRSDMILPRTDDESDVCPPGHVSCSPSNIVVVGSNDGTSTTDNSTQSTHSSYLDKPGMHRYIGIAMVAVLVLVIFALWVYFARYPKRKLAHISQSCCGRRKKSSNTLRAPGESSSSTTSSSRSGSEDGEDDDADDDANAAGRPKAKPSRRRSEKEKEKERNLMLQAEPKGVIKEVSGGIVMYTEVPRPALLPRRDRYPRADWEFEHIHGVRFEIIFYLIQQARTPPRHPSNKPARPRS
ncbi:hypothetical protein BDZ97DRAFT_412617 [Flammula alnicola]|nr:hypothetical protein BDZ97DRAFT_412617 [Flammula alnicola]